MVLRYARTSDMDAICRIWQDSFGDSEEFVRAFFQKTQILTTTVVAEIEGEVCSLMCAFDNIGGMTYLYALCTAPEYRGRGIGGRVLKESISLAKGRGAAFVGLHPADEGLSKWYEKNFGLTPLGYFTEEEFTPTEAGPSAKRADYFCLIAADGTITKQLCAAQETLAGYYGGQLLQVGKTLVYADKREERVTVKAIIGGKREDFTQDEIFSSAAKYFSASKLIARHYSKDKPVNGSKYYVNLLVSPLPADFQPSDALFGFQYILD